MNMRKAFILVLAFTWAREAGASGAPSLTGIPGLVRIPTAEFMRDGIIYGGASFIPRETLAYSKYRHDGLVSFISMTFLPFIEFDLRLTKQLGVPPSQHHTVDRSPSLRFKLLRDKGAVPAVVLGFHDIFSTVEEGEARHFGATYLVATKIFKINHLLVIPTLGYGLDAIEAKGYEFVGFFSGLKFQIFRHRQFGLSIDYDSEMINIGADAVFFHLLYLKCALLNMRYFSFGASMHFNLFDVF